MLSVYRPAQSNVVSGRAFQQRFHVEQNLQTAKRRKDHIGVIPNSAPIVQAPRVTSAVNTSLPPQTQQPFQEFTPNLSRYFTLLNTKLINDFLLCDKCFKVSDKYVLSMVFIYFIRAEFAVTEYTTENFFIALYLALDMEDDVEEFKFELFPWCLGKEWKRNYPLFLQSRDRLWRRMNYRALCSKATCDEIMRILPSRHWFRVRDENHGGAIRKCRQPPHPNNEMPVGPFGSPVPCVHCILNREEEEKFMSELDNSSGSGSPKAKVEEEIFFTADDGSFSMSSGNSAEIFTDVKPANASFTLLDPKLSSGGYRDRPLSLDTEPDDDEVKDELDVLNNDDDDDDDGDGDIFWVKSDVDRTADSALDSALHDISPSEATKNIFSLPCSSEDEIEVVGKEENRQRVSAAALSDIFWDSSDDAETSVKSVDEGKRAPSKSRREPRRAQRSFSRINLRCTFTDANTNRSSPKRDIFSKEP